MAFLTWSTASTCKVCHFLLPVGGVVADFQSQFKSSKSGSGLEQIAKSRGFGSQKSNFIEQFNKVRCQLAI